MRTATIEVEGARIVVRQKTTGDEMAAAAMTRKLATTNPENWRDDEYTLERALTKTGFAHVMAQTVSIEGADMPLIHPAMPPDQLDEAFEKFLLLPSALTDKWAEAANGLETASGDPGMLPLEALTEEERRDPN